MNKFIKPLVALVVTTLISTAALAGVTTVADTHENRAELAGQEITITGKVVKVNNGVMKRNFIHVTDGTGTGEQAKLIFTSNQTAVVGDQITITGTVALDTDFGMGYFYATLVENATLELVQ